VACSSREWLCSPDPRMICSSARSSTDMPRCFSHMSLLLMGQHIFAIHRVEPLQLYNNIDHGHLFRLHLFGRKRRTTQAILD